MRRRERPSGGQATDHDIAEFVGTPLYQRVAALAALCFPGEHTAPHRPRRPPPRPGVALVPSRIYTNAMQFGDVAHVHQVRDGLKFLLLVISSADVS
jgi:hypothetical protein